MSDDGHDHWERVARLFDQLAGTTADQRESILAAGLALQGAGVIPANVDVKATVDDLIDARYLSRATN